jgi:ELWxxDGT repeat protein
MKSTSIGLGRVAATAIAMALAHTGSAGTVSLLADLDTNEVIASTNPWFLGEAGQRAIFGGNVPGLQGQRLFRSDGTAQGTVRFAAQDLVDPRPLGSVSGRLLITAFTDASHAETRLWATDGTDAGTTMIRVIGPGERTVSLLASNADRLYFCANTEWFADCEPYVTDGTAAGTVQLAPGRTAFGGRALTASGGLYFFSNSTAGGDSGLWHSDGTRPGTRALFSFAALGYEAVGPIAWSDANNLYVNVQNTAHLRGLYRLNVTTGATVPIAPNGFSSFAENALELGGLRYFIMDSILWRSDGTPAGTVQLTPTPSLPFAAVNPLRRVGNRVVFVNSDATHGAELWASDGTVAGTVRLADAAPGPEGYTNILTATADRVFFLAGPLNNQHFWVSDGTTVGTRAIPLRGGGAYSLEGFDFFNASAAAGDRVFLTAFETVSGGGFSQQRRLWSTDLSGTDVLELGDGGTQIQVLGNRAFYANMADPVGTEPWVSDGTVAGTARILDLAVSGQTEHSSPMWFTVAGPRTFFAATDREHGRELWVTDGTGAGTRRVRDINPGTGNSFPTNLLAVGGDLYFDAGATLDNSERRVWRSDGTEAGTIPLGDVLSHDASCGPWAAAMNGRVWFFGHSPPSSAVEVWSTDGSALGTRREFLLPEEIRYRPACHLLPSANGLVFTSGYSATAGTLWRTDGTEAGTRQLGDLTPVGAGAGEPQGHSLFAAVGGYVYLLADDPAAGRELWRTDGTDSGTTLVADLTPGPEGAQLFSIRAFGLGALFTYRSAPGSADGIYRVAPVLPAPERIKAGAVGTRLPATATRVFFTFDDAGTGALWATDGTVAGTNAVFNAAAGSTLPINSMVAGDSFLFFHGPIDASGHQMWMTDGRASLTHRLSNLTSFFLNDDWQVLNDRPLFAFEDGVHGSEPWTVVNQPPVALPDSAATTRNTSVLIPVRANDSDPDSTDLVIAILAQPAHGTLVPEGAGLRYSPTTGYVGSDNFDYLLFDEFNANSAITPVTITVSAPASPPPGNGGGKKKGGGALEWITLALLATLWLRRLPARSRYRPSLLPTRYP